MKLTSCVNFHNYLDRNFIEQLVEVEFLMNFEQKKIEIPQEIFGMAGHL